jgi:hypothetical protein
MMFDCCLITFLEQDILHGSELHKRRMAAGKGASDAVKLV